MNYRLSHDKRIIFDIKQAVSYYDEISRDLGEKFELELFLTFEKIKKHPHHYFNISSKYRRTNLDNFPYKLIYRINEGHKKVEVIRLLHQFKKPQKRIVRRKN